jgi:hypothetical protein
VANKLSAELIAKINSVLRGADRAAFVWGLIFVSVFAISAVFYARTLSLVFAAGILISLISLVALMVVQLVLHRNVVDAEAPRMSVTLRGTTEVEVRAPIRADSDVLSILREVLQGRRPLPDPHGSVRPGASPARIEMLHQYTPQERQDAAAAISEGIRERERGFAEELRRIPVQDKLAVDPPQSGVLPAAHGPKESDVGGGLPSAE